MKLLVFSVSYFSQLIPETYLTTPMLFPFLSTSQSTLGNNATRGITEDERLVSRILPNECCWLAQIGHAITRIPDEFMVRISI